MRINKLVIVFSCMLGAYAPNIQTGPFTGGGSSFTGTPSGASSTPAGNNNSNANNNPNVPVKAVISNILSANPTSSTTPAPYKTYGPTDIITHLATAETKFFTTYSNTPNRVDSWTIGSPTSSTFSTNASGEISKLVSGDNLVAALNSADQHVADLWTFDGSTQFTNTIDNPIVDSVCKWV
ncbi:MAG: hypothetical protein NTU89_01260 [Candidatus Dependentiae bacterium]|nr:hypothetical protein [Candidatus Dependentiae bacterium]